MDVPTPQPEPEPVVANLLKPLTFSTKHIRRQLDRAKERVAHIPHHQPPYNIHQRQALASVVKAYEDFLKKLETTYKRDFVEVIITMGFALSRPEIEANQGVVRECREELDRLEKEMERETQELNIWSYGLLGVANP
jgi:hypothetical protein